jgi:cytosine/adenosine deaminase-related metal-dependent hydrolase
MSDGQPLLIRNARVVGVNGAKREFVGDVLVRNGRIVEIGQIPITEGVEVIEARRGLLLPGFVDTHRHVWQTQLRTAAGDWSLYDYLINMRMTYSAFYQPEDVYLGNYVGALEAINAGVTTVVDHCHILNSPDHTDEAIRGLDDSGIRAVFCYGLFANPVSHDPFVINPDMSWRLEDARRVRKGRLSSDASRIQFGLAPNEPESISFDAGIADIAFARELGARVISCHVAMGAYDQGHQYVRRLNEAGLLLPEFLFVHGSSLMDDELRMIADAGAGISSTPETELQMGMGYPVAMRARQAGAFASIGVDIVSNYSGDLFTQMRMMVQSARAQAHALLETQRIAPRSVGVLAEDVLRLATLGGAESIGLADRIGTVEVGKKADLILLRTDSIGMVPATNAVSAAVFNAKPDDVEVVVVDGHIVKRDGALIGVDWPAIAKRLEDSAERIVSAGRAVDPSIAAGVINGFFDNLH